MVSRFRISSSFWIAAALIAAPLAPTKAGARCQTGLASAPYIGAADMRAIDKAAARLPHVKAGRLHTSIGRPVPAGVRHGPLPKPVAEVLPQYRGYQAFRVGSRLAITDKRGVLSYLMPLGERAKPSNCP